MHQSTVKHLSRRKPDYALDRELYTAAEVFHDDLKELYFKEWLFVTPACELAKPGNYVTYKVGDYQIVVVRGRDKEIRAFHNTCRHRGSVRGSGSGCTVQSP